MDPTEDIIKREVAEAARILREDGHAVRLSAIEAKLDKHFPDENPDGGTDPNGPKKPDKKEEPSKSGETKRGGIWWGDAVQDE